MSQPKQNKRKMKTGFQTRTNFIIIGVSILVSVLLIVGVLYLFGIRYVKYRFETGFSVSFVGVLNGDGMPATGHISYGGEQIREQIQAVYDAGYEEWILWNARNHYESEGLLPDSGATSD